MSKLRLNSRRGRWSLVLAILIILVTAGVVLAAMTVGQVTSQWSSAVGGACLAYDSGYNNTSRVKWGRSSWSCPSDWDTAKSGYTFAGVNPGSVTPNSDFLLGQFTHHNNPISSGTSISQVSFALQVPICGSTKTFTGYIFYHDETPNSDDPCAYGPGSIGWPGGSGSPNVSGDTGPNRNGCADRVTLPYQIPPVTFTCPGYTGDFTLYLSGFIPITSGSCPAQPSGTQARYFYTAETTDNLACVYGRITVPSAITLAAFTAAQEADAIQVSWDTASELNNAGFNLYRDTTPGGVGVKLNDLLIPSQGPNSPEGFSYSYTDTANLVDGTTYYYLLEDVSLSGNATLHEPVSVTYHAPTAVTLASFGAATSAPAALPVAGLVLATLGAAAVARRRKG